MIELTLRGLLNRARSLISAKRDPQFLISDPQEIDLEFDRQMSIGKKLILGTLCARSGTRWLCDIFSAHQAVTAVTERNKVAESYYRYIHYNELPIDSTGIITLIKAGIIADWKNNDTSVVFSPYFSHGLLPLVHQLKPSTVIFAINEPLATVNSILNKGHFTEKYLYPDLNTALGYQPALGDRWSHYFGRIVPKAEQLEDWLKLSRAGKVSWWANMITMDIYEQICALPHKSVFIFKLKEADQNYEYYVKFAEYFSLAPQLDINTFMRIKSLSVRKDDNNDVIKSSDSLEEFESLTSDWRMLYNSLPDFLQ